MVNDFDYTDFDVYSLKLDLLTEAPSECIKARKKGCADNLYEYSSEELKELGINDLFELLLTFFKNPEESNIIDVKDIKELENDLKSNVILDCSVYSDNELNVNRLYVTISNSDYEYEIAYNIVK